MILQLKKKNRGSSCRLKDYPGPKKRMSCFILGPKTTTIIIHELYQKEKKSSKGNKN